MSEKFNPVFIGTIKEGRLFFPGEVTAKRWLDRLRSFEGQEVQITVSKRRKKRTLKQNSYYWGAVLPLLAEESGHTDEEIHRALTLKFLKSKLDDNLEVIKSTSELSRGEFAEYLMEVELWAIDTLGITRLPDPDEWDPVQWNG